MATYKGHDIIKPDQETSDLKLRGPFTPGSESVDFPVDEEAGADWTPRPGQKHYLSTQPIAKKGSYTVPKMCGGGKVLKSWSK